MGELPSIALSIRQPWAWAIVAGHKDIENRTTFAVNKGDMEPRDICIHAAKGMTQDEYFSTSEFMFSMGIICPSPDLLLRGGIIGVCTVIDVVKEHDSPWFFGPRGLVLTSQREIEPIPSTGALGYFRWRKSGAFDEPKPWMLGETRKRKKHRVCDVPLFEPSQPEGEK